ncbi:hypothetical protein PF005_g13090 [Phytophthora fragariae]|uniref:Uncharacterized protein n=1 Tax=Phytophthora fragariae TaxID=53985 RepID=A0A6A3XVB2_9STRA|nr:hypothetical protein PF009_g14383 [Phytophthora fragariae]KAE9106216.1 hypothetical protein PF007_g13491 [Phytophthora fragariae]KAE9206233.1 hypothetical protein PF005_g13090 [Phytophthora fragariae]KAE9223862.1 hypothetical protein PF004_g12381 [Phytophthora fragariae]
MEPATAPEKDGDVLQHAELAAMNAPFAAETTSGKKRCKHYSFKMKRERPAQKKEEIFAFTGSEKTLSRSPGRPETVPFGMEIIMYMKDTRRDRLSLTARSMAAFARESYLDWLRLYVEDKKDASTAYESLLRLLRCFAYHHGFMQRTPSGLKVLYNRHNCCTTVFCATKTDAVLFTM